MDTQALIDTLPETEQQVIERFEKLYSDNLLKSNLIGIFNVCRKMGDTILAAYEYTLKSHLKTCRFKEVQKGVNDCGSDFFEDMRIK